MFLKASGLRANDSFGNQLNGRATLREEVGTADTDGLIIKMILGRRF